MARQCDFVIFCLLRDRRSPWLLDSRNKATSPGKSGGTNVALLSSYFLSLCLVSPSSHPWGVSGTIEINGVNQQGSRKQPRSLALCPLDVAFPPRLRLRQVEGNSLLDQEIRASRTTEDGGNRPKPPQSIHITKHPKYALLWVSSFRLVKSRNHPLAF